MAAMAAPPSIGAAVKAGAKPEEVELPPAAPEAADEPAAPADEARDEPAAPALEAAALAPLLREDATLDKLEPAAPITEKMVLEPTVEVAMALLSEEMVVRMALVEMAVLDPEPPVAPPAPAVPLPEPDPPPAPVSIAVTAAVLVTPAEAQRALA